MYSRPLSIGVITPYLSGFYLGEISAHLTRECQQRGHNLITIRSNGFAQYDAPIAFDYIDVLLVIMNAASRSLIEKAIAKGIHVVSTVDDYFPLAVDQVTSHQEQGVRDAIDHLTKLGHSKIGFAGDLSILDIRNRHREYKRTLIDRGISIDPSWTLGVHEPTLPGGREAGRLFTESNLDCTAMLCATDLIAVGFTEQVKKHGIECPDDIAVIGIDNTVLGATRSTELTSVDQNLLQLVKTCIDRLETRFAGDSSEPTVNMVSQNLVVRSSCGSPQYKRSNSDSSTAIKRRLIDEFSQSPTDNNESSMALAKGGIDSLLNLSSLYGPFLEWGCFAQFVENKDQIKVQRFFSEAYLTEDHLELAQRFTTTSFPPLSLLGHSTPKHFSLTLIPISEGEESIAGVLALVDDLRSTTSASLYSMFNNYLDLLTLFIERDSLLTSIKQREKNAQTLANTLAAVADTSNDGIWDWDLNSNVVEWNNRLLDMLGFQRESDKRLLNSMNFFERVHPQDVADLKANVRDHLKTNRQFKYRFRLQSADDNYLWVAATGKAIRDKQGRAVRFVGSVTDITSEKEHNEQIQHMAYHDSLTGLPNRAKLNDYIHGHLDHEPSVDRAIMLMDLNRFKYVNDSFGHDIGDALLTHIAYQVKSIVGDDAFFARFGGDEFVFVTTIDSEQCALEFASRIQNRVEEPFVFGDLELSVQSSIGIALYPQHGDQVDELIKKADIAMYEAKSTKTNSAVIYTHSMQSDVQTQVRLEQALNKAILEEQIDVHYQPQFCLKSGQLSGVEALARWHSPQFGQVPPEQFISLAEETGQIVKLGEHIATKAIKQLVQWQTQFTQLNLKMSINVSAGQLKKENFSQEFNQLIELVGANPSDIIIEITESATIDNLMQTRAVLSKIAQTGVQISLDDFGTGYSSLLLLQQLPLNHVKIDRSFVQNIDREGTDFELVKSVVLMCKAFGYSVVAEGVEHAGHEKQVIKAGCHFSQGYYYDKPSDARTFELGYLKQFERSSA